MGVTGPDIGWIERAQAAGLSREDIQAYLDAWAKRVESVDPMWRVNKRARDRERMEKKRLATISDVATESPPTGEQKKVPLEPPKENTTKTPPTEGQKETVAPIFPDAEDIELALDAYRQVAEQRGLPLVRKVTDVRLRKLKRRLRDCGSLDGWYEACRKLQQSKFLAEIRADLDFLLQEKSFVRLIEGRYDEHKKAV